MAIAAEIRKDIKGWVQCQFIFTSRQQKCLSLMPDDLLDEIGNQIARAIEKLYPLEISVSDDTIPPTESKKNGEVDIGWSQSEGFHIEIKFRF